MSRLLDKLTGIKQRNESISNPLSYYMSSNSEKQTMVEGLIRTFPLEVAKKHFIRYMGMDERFFKIYTADNGVKKAVIYLDYNENDINDAVKAMTFYGYGLSYTDHIEENGDHVVALYFEPKHQEDNVGENEPFFLHLTPSKHLDKVLTNGICPRESEKNNFDHEPCVYLLGAIPMSSVYYLASQLNDSMKEEGDNVWYVLKINAEEVRKKGKLSYDPNFIRGYIYKGNVSPSAIEDNTKIFLKYF